MTSPPTADKQTLTRRRRRRHRYYTYQGGHGKDLHGARRGGHDAQVVVRYKVTHQALIVLQKTEEEARVSVRPVCGAATYQRRRREELDRLADDAHQVVMVVLGERRHHGRVDLAARVKYIGTCIGKSSNTF